MIEINKKIFIILGSYEDNSNNIYELNEDKLVIASPVDVKKINKSKKSEYKKLTYSTFLGFMSPFKKKYSIFKIKDTTKKRDTGFRCDQKGKIDILRTLNKTIQEGEKTDEEYFTYENTESIENARELCVDQEILFRYYNIINKNGTTWFLSLEDYLFTKLI